MSRPPREALLTLGSNVEPDASIASALALLEARFGVVEVSPRYRSPAVGGTGTYPDFVNLAVCVRTDCPPRALREACRRVEEACGRRRSADRYAPRTMDIDVALLDGIVFEGPTWCVPDPDLATQAHCLVPCADLRPRALHPVVGTTLAALRDALPADARNRLVRVAEPSGAGA